MATRTFLAPGASLVVGLTAGLLAQQATATEELVVHGTRGLYNVPFEHEIVRADIETYVRSLNERLRVTIDADLKRATEPKVDLVSNELAARG
jgi:hypothetical protein